MERLELGKYVVSDPAICHGKLTFKGTRVLVEPVLAMFINGCNIDRILKGYPTITKEAIQEALRLAIHKLIADYPGAPQPCRLCDKAYCIIYFHIASEKQEQIPILLRRLFKIPDFATIRERMGKVVRVSPEGIRYYERNVPGEQRMSWPVL
jgi:uncharacterized protein (DUF433 family)